MLAIQKTISSAHVPMTASEMSCKRNLNRLVPVAEAVGRSAVLNTAEDMNAVGRTSVYTWFSCCAGGSRHAWMLKPRVTS